VVRVAGSRSQGVDPSLVHTLRDSACRETAIEGAFGPSPRASVLPATSCPDREATRLIRVLAELANFHTNCFDVKLDLVHEN
jgi:hypothetical protein